MEITEILERFCGSSTMRPEFITPYHVGEWTVACNGHMAIRIPRIEAIYPEREEDLKFFSLFPEGPESLTYTDIPDMSKAVTDIVCPKCQGEDKIVCPECGGSGMATAWNSHSEYVVDCNTCDGIGETTCCLCDGSKKILNDRTIEVAGILFRESYIKIISELPDVSFCVEKVCITREKEMPAYFRFDGGEGILMPCSS